jgi:DNA-binding response OmpR family regulator
MASTVGKPHGAGYPESSDRVLKAAFIGDDQSLADLYRLKLEMDGYWVTQASTLAEGLRRLRDHQPDIVFLDIGLGNEAGMEALGTLRREPDLKGLPVVLLLRGEGALGVNGLQLGSRDFLIKAERVSSREIRAELPGWNIP